MEKNLEDEKDRELLSYANSLEECKKETEGLLDHVTGVLENLNTLQENYHFVSNKTNSLHMSCQQLIEDQVFISTN